MRIGSPIPTANAATVAGLWINSVLTEVMEIEYPMRIWGKARIRQHFTVVVDRCRVSRYSVAGRRQM